MFNLNINLCLLVYLSVIGAENLLDLVSLESHPLAQCNDGSPAVYYRKPLSSEADVRKLMIYLKGGGMCLPLVPGLCSVSPHVGRLSDFKQHRRRLHGEMQGQWPPVHGSHWPLPWSWGLLRRLNLQSGSPEEPSLPWLQHRSGKSWSGMTLIFISSLCPLLQQWLVYRDQERQRAHRWICVPWQIHCQSHHPGSDSEYLDNWGRGGETWKSQVQETNDPL